MKTAVDARLRMEAERLCFRFACEDCVHFDDHTEACSLGYPTEPHRRGALSLCELEFCKEFDVA